MQTTAITIAQVRDALGDLDHDRDNDGPILVSETDGAVRLILGPLAGADQRLAEDGYRQAAERRTAQTAANRLASAGLTVDVDALAAGVRVRVRPADYGTLTDYRTGEPIRPATADEHARSLAAGETGAIEDETGRAVFVAGGPES